MDNSNIQSEVNNFVTVSQKLPFIFIFAIFCYISAINVPIITTLWRHGFDDGTYSHAFIIPFISLFLYYKLNDIQKLEFRERPDFYFLTCLALCGVIFYIMSSAQISIGYWFASLILLTVTVLTLFRFNWYVVFPAAYLIFIFPFWGSLIGMLQTMSVAAVGFMMSFTSIPTYVEAQYVSIPAGTFEIANGCSGLRYLIVSLSISSLYIFLFINNIKRAGLFFLVAILGGLITNWLRITILVLIGHQTDMTHSLMNDHNNFGWYIYLPFMFLLFMFGNKLKDHDLLQPLIPIKALTLKKNTRPNFIIVISSIAILLISSTFSQNLMSNHVIEDNKQSSLPSPSPKIYNYSNIQTITTSALPINTTYNVYSYSSKDLDSKPTYFENIYLTKGWEIERDISTSEWQVFIVNKQDKKAIIAYSFQLGNFKTASSKLYKIQRIKSAFSNSAAPKLHWFKAPCSNNCIGSSTKVKTFIAQH